MGITLNSKMADDGPAIAYTERFRQVLEDHIPWFRELESTVMLDVAPAIANQHDGDIIGVLNHYNQPRELHWLIMRLNGYSSPMEYKSEHNRLLIPSREDFSSVLKVHRTTQKMGEKSKK